MPWGTVALGEMTIQSYVLDKLQIIIFSDW